MGKPSVQYRQAMLVEEFMKSNTIVVNYKIINSRRDELYHAAEEVALKSPRQRLLYVFCHK